MNTSDLHSSDVHSCNARQNTFSHKYSRSPWKKSGRTTRTRHMTKARGLRGYLLVVCTKRGIHRDSTSMSVFEHGLKLEVVLNSDDEWHVVSTQFPRDGSNDKLLVGEYYLLIGLYLEPY